MINMTFQTPRGTRDFLPEDMIRREYVISKIRGVFEKWGFDPIETPAFEDWSLLSAKQGSGDEIKKEIYYFKDKSDRELGLRFDFTVPLARFVTNNPNMPKPFRRYQMGPVWRYDRPGSGRYREFWQCDVDVVGAPTGEADATCIAVACDALKNLGFDNFTVRLSSRKILQAFLLKIGIEKDSIPDVLRSIDKLEKNGEEAVSKELNDKKIGKDRIREIIGFTKTKTLAEAKKLVGESGEEGISELENIFEFIDAFGIGDYVKFDPGLVRGLEYYTGPVFEITSEKFKSSIAGGGRYDNMIEIFGGKPTPATGIALGVERIIEILAENNMLDTPKTKTKIYIAPVADTVVKDAIKLCKDLIAAGIPAEFDLMRRSLTKELDYANAKGIPFVIILGEKEIKSGKIKLRDMKSGEEHEINLSGLEDVKRYVV